MNPHRSIVLSFRHIHNPLHFCSERPAEFAPEGSSCPQSGKQVSSALFQAAVWLSFFLSFIPYNIKTPNVKSKTNFVHISGALTLGWKIHILSGTRPVTGKRRADAVGEGGGNSVTWKHTPLRKRKLILSSRNAGHVAMPVYHWTIF